MEQARERDLLLVAAGELARGLRRARALDRHPGDPRVRRLLLPGGQDQRPRTERLEPGQRQVVRHAQAEREPFALAVLAQQAHAGAPASARALSQRAATVDADPDPAAG